MNRKAVFICSPGFNRKTGYYFRVERDKESFERLGYEVELIVLGSIFSFFKCFFKRFSTFDVIILQNIGAALPLLLSLNLFKEKILLKTILISHGSLGDVDSFRFSWLRKPIYKYIERYFFKSKTKIVCVSNYMATALVERYEPVRATVEVIPNIPSSSFLNILDQYSEYDRSGLREKLGLPLERKIICYAGNSQSWQKPGLLIQLIAHSPMSFLFIILTRDVDFFRSELGSIERDNYIIKTVDNDDVPKYLLASDLLYLLREQSEVNKFSCPTKGVEYLLSGTPLLISRNVGDISSEVSFCGHSLITDSTEEESVETLIKEVLQFSHNPPNSDLHTQLRYKYSIDYHDSIFKRLLASPN